MVDRRVRYLVISLVFLKELRLGFKARHAERESESEYLVSRVRPA